MYYFTRLKNFRFHLKISRVALDNSASMTERLIEEVNDQKMIFFCTQLIIYKIPFKEFLIIMKDNKINEEAFKWRCACSFIKIKREKQKLFLLLHIILRLHHLLCDCDLL